MNVAIHTTSVEFEQFEKDQIEIEFIGRNIGELMLVRLSYT